MERLEKDWNVYPVFHIDFSLTKYNYPVRFAGTVESVFTSL